MKFQSPGDIAVESNADYRYPKPLNLSFDELFKPLPNADASDTDDDLFLALIPGRSSDDCESDVKRKLLDSVRHLTDSEDDPTPVTHFQLNVPYERGPFKSPDADEIGRILQEESLASNEDCDEYCRYIKKIAEDSLELERHLKSLELVEHCPRSIPERAPKKSYADSRYVKKFLRQNQISPRSFHRFDPSTSESESRDSSLDDFVAKLNQSDEEALIPSEDGGGKEYSRSVDDLLCAELFSEASAKRKIPEMSSFGFSKLLVDGKEAQSLSRSVLDLTKVGLPRKESSKAFVENVIDERPEILEDRNPAAGADIKLLVRTVDAGKSEIEIRTVSRSNENLPSRLVRPDFSVLDRRSSEVFGQRADSSPYQEERGKRPPKPAALTQSLQSLNNEKRKKKAYRDYDQLQSMHCLSDDRHDFGRRPERVSRTAAPKTKGLLFEIRDKPLADTAPSGSAIINRVYVHTPYEKELRDLNKPVKSILKKPTKNFEPLFQSVSLLSLPGSRAGVFKRDSYIKHALGKSRSCGNVASNARDAGDLTPRMSSSEWQKYFIPTSPLSGNRSMSGSLNDFLQAESRPGGTNPPATLIQYVTPDEVSRAKAYVDYYDWSKDSQDESNLTDFEYLPRRSDDTVRYRSRNGQDRRLAK